MHLRHRHRASRLLKFRALWRWGKKRKGFSDDDDGYDLRILMTWHCHCRYGAFCVNHGSCRNRQVFVPSSPGTICRVGIPYNTRLIRLQQCHDRYKRNPAIKMREARMLTARQVATNRLRQAVSTCPKPQTNFVVEAKSAQTFQHPLIKESNLKSY